MQRLRILSIAVLTIALSPSWTSAQESTDRKPSAQSLETIQWMLGEWTMETDRTLTTESWSTVNERIIRGSGTTVAKADGRVLSAESLLLVKMSGTVFYIAKVAQNERPIPFTLMESSEKHAIFSNPEHDFPRKLEYRLQEAGRMEVTVSDGESKSFKMIFKKKVPKKKTDTDE